MFPNRLGSVVPQFVIDVIGVFGCTLNNAASITSGVFPTANKVIYMPIRVPSSMLIQQLYCINGATVSGNVEVGLYTMDGTKIVSSGSVAQAATNVKQLFNITDTLIGRGAYYMAVTLDNTTGTFFRAVPANAAMAGLLGLLTETTGGFGLPATATFNAAADAYLPMAGLLAQSLM